MKRVGFVGWRGMVGSVLAHRLHEEGDLKDAKVTYFSTSSAGGTHRDVAGVSYLLSDAMSIEKLSEMDVIVTCQGGDYTKAVYGPLRASGWNGYWIDAASAKRMNPDAIIVLDPVNRAQIDAGIDSGIRNFIGGNCSITLSLLGLAGLFREDLVEWMSVMTYQAASGAGAAHVKELLSQQACISRAVAGTLESAPVHELLAKARAASRDPDFPTVAFGAPLAGSLIPWIDTDLGNGTSREEWKGEVETNKILGLPQGSIKVDGLCVRVAALQSHSAAITLKLKTKVGFPELERLISQAHEWVDYVPNRKDASIQRLSPAAVSGTLRVGVGRLRLLSIGNGDIWSVMTTGDQLLWGAAEPLRRVLSILLAR
ncbi:aspartate-semialdehyde dehydrogenase [Sphingomonas sp. NCPPB 2930]